MPMKQQNTHTSGYIQALYMQYMGKHTVYNRAKIGVAF